MEIQADDKIEIDGIVIGPGMTEGQAKLLAAKLLAAKLLAAKLLAAKLLAAKGAEVAAFVMMTLAKMLAA